MSNKLTAYLESQMQALKLKGMLAHYQEITEKASQNNLSYTEYLSLLFEEELKRKNEGTVKTKINKARFPFIKTLEEFDFSFQPSIREKEIISLSSLDFVEKKENIIFLGPPGVGKTHLSVALGIKACMAKYRVVFITAQKLLEELLLSAKDGSLLDKLLGYSRLNLLIIDELGYMPVTKEQANLLFRLVSMRYEKGSIILTSNYNFNEWGEIFSDQVVAAAIIDRLVHHARIFYINGTSYRLKGKLKAANDR
ncbi:IS21-like element helper ATPase IstB [Neomoorella thermoacetica]|jgi:DNA replication protein DnaC|uniref:Chromosomal replication initiator protein DnaA n=4 Tax=Neomoorella thermoacetica TaxID=1525 RepID=A0A1D7X6W7_NEOTH|nr:IS21-like element helper ATPase IstB [Moorella thermoacetica]AKX93129.1 chromosomal replication initiator protein DnaA [Moorella thermoacetica]AKX94929.1 chromosomal replication initiator protein DnaA [Moorella thermoacetica]AKX95089.1 chromosomal replication initiator protein DnaA [Moorella thermoacetica]AKX95673.1 chromosomal replication initiator protein DnaA [Moorella thermoacetica]AKX96040.1 chromosomal replication initiator protein DnaA [Moorella thermoacetica]